MITDGESDSETQSSYTITEGNRPYAKVVFVWKKSRIKEPVDGSVELESAWLFEKITGLPRNLYPHGDGPKTVARLEDHATVRVTGSKDALQQFGASRHP